MQELATHSTLARRVSTASIPEPVSPITAQVEALAAQLACAQEGLTLLYMKLEPVRSTNPIADQATDRAPAASPLEGRLADLIEAAAFLNVQMSNLRGELRI